MFSIGKGMVRGVVEGPYLVGIGASVFLEMTEEEWREHRRKSRVDGQGAQAVVNKGQVSYELPGMGEEREIKEEMTEEDLKLLGSRTKPRIAHAPQISTKKVTIPKVELDEDMDRLEVGPVKSKVVERTGQSSVSDPSQTVMRSQVRESLFKRNLNSSTKNDNSQ